MPLADPWPEAKPGRPRRKGRYVEMTFRVSEAQREVLERLADRGLARDAHAMAKLILDKELLRLAEAFLANEKPPAS